MSGAQLLANLTYIRKIQRAQNEALMVITGSHKMSSIDHLHNETKMLQVEDHLNLHSAQYLVHCLDTENVYHQHGSSTKGNERDNLHQTQPNRVTTASKQ